MQPCKRFSARAMLRAKLTELHGEEFESFFHSLMELGHPGFLSVRTYGNIGDLSADGLMVNERKLYGTVTQAWRRLHEWRAAHRHNAPLPFWWFVLALDVLYALGTVELRNDVFVFREQPDAA